MTQISLIAEAFLEQSWDDAGAARVARDDRAAQLQAAGYECTCSDLWNVAGYRVYVLSAQPIAEAKRVIPSSAASLERGNNGRDSRSRRSDINKQQRPARRRVVTEIR
jgi:hypothetical protein